MAIQIPLTQDKFTVIDEADIPFINHYKWFAQKQGRHWYATAYATNQEGKQIYVRLHRLIMSARPGEFVDHADGDGLNNSRENLRLCDRSQNNRNRRLDVDSTSGFKGVSWHKQHEKWAAQINHDGKRIYLGIYHSKEEAARAYDAKARELHGEFARLNFPIGQDIRGEFLTGGR